MTIPKKIYLQIVDDEGNELDPMKDEVTWCWDKINDNDVEYEIVPTPRALDFCPECDNTGYRRVSPTILAKCSCQHGQSQ